MREIISITYEALDGVIFDDPLSCQAYERFDEMTNLYENRKKGIIFNNYNDCAVYVTWLVNYKASYNEYFNPHEYIRTYPDLIRKKCVIDVNRKGEIIHRFK